MKPERLAVVIRRLRREVRRWPVPVIGNYTRSPFTCLISCLLSLRTKDATTDAASERLFAVADTPESLLAVPVETIERLIYPVSFYRVKARTIHRICGTLIDDYGGRVPDDLDELLKLHGVGRKTANIVVTLAYGKSGIAVDTHVHRISNRLGLVRTKHADATEMALRRKLPERYWIEMNDLLVAFGQHHCTPVRPKCSNCALAALCPKRGVRKHR